MKNLKNKKGITLVALAITIVVLLILAAIIINSINNNGIIGKANDAKEATEKKTEIEELELIISESILEGQGEINFDYLDSKIENNFDKRNGIYTSKKTSIKYIVNKSGKVDIFIPWIDNKDGTISKDGQILKIGDYINYIASNESCLIKKNLSGSRNNQTLYSEKLNWRILGVDEDGFLKLISANSVSTLNLNGVLGWTNSENILNETCNSLYGKGNGAIKARSLNIDDCNILQCYTPAETNYYKYAYADGYVRKKMAEQIEVENGNYNFEDVEKWEKFSPNFMYGIDEDGTSWTINSKNNVRKVIKINEYSYSLTTDLSKVIKYKEDGKNYANSWIAFRCVKKNSNFFSFAVRRIYDGKVGYQYDGLYGGLNGEYNYGGGVTASIRPVVILGNIKINMCEGENSSTNMHEIN